MRYLVTQTLISSWYYALTTENGNDDFLATLRREKKQPTKAMLAGQKFESIINAVCNGAIITPEHEWYKPITEIVEIVKHAQQQVRLYRDIEVEGMSFVVNGVIDYLYASQIFDAKFSAIYRVGKFLTSPQTQFYFYLAPEAKSFTYLVSEGEYLYQEKYTPDEVEPIERTIKNFIDYLKRTSLLDVYLSNWQSKY